MARLSNSTNLSVSPSAGSVDWRELRLILIDFDALEGDN